MPPQTGYTWTAAEVAALVARIESLEGSRDFMAARGAFVYAMNDGTGGALPAAGGLCMLVHWAAWSYALAAPAGVGAEVAQLELVNPTPFTQTVNVTGGSMASIVLAPGGACVLAAGTEGTTAPKWYVQSAHNATIS